MRFKKIFNLIYKDKMSEDKLSRYRSLFNIIATKYSITDNEIIKKEYILFNKVILKRIDSQQDRIWKFGNSKIIKKENIRSLFQKKIKIDKKYDDIYFLSANSGEIYIFLKYILSDILKSHNGKNPLLIASKDYHKSLAHLFFPEIPCIKFKYNMLIQKEYFKINDKHYTYIVPKGHFKNVDNEEKLKTCNYFRALLNLFECNNNCPKTPVISNINKENMLKKIAKTKLNLDKFVIIIPKANSCKNIEKSFWTELINKFQNAGFDVFINSPDYKCAKYTFLSYEEILALAHLAKRIVSIRCGLSELLSETNVKTDILYTAFKDRLFLNALKVECIMSGFSLKHLPHVNKNLISEINAQDDFENIYKKLGF